MPCLNFSGSAILISSTNINAIVILKKIKNFVSNPLNCYCITKQDDFYPTFPCLNRLVVCHTSFYYPNINLIHFKFLYKKTKNVTYTPSWSIITSKHTPRCVINIMLKSFVIIFTESKYRSV